MSTVGLRAFPYALLASLAVFLLAVAAKKPSDTRNWQPHLGITPFAEAAGQYWEIGPIRDWSYSETGPVRTSWQASQTIDIETISRVWLVVEPHPGLPIMAHTLVLFEFEDSSLIGLTIEARKESHERFAPIRGALNRFELIYVWATPRDLLTRRSVFLDHELELYPLELTGSQAKAFILRTLERTQRLSERPRFYNTLFSNCTNELAKAADLDWDPAFILTGDAAKALHRRGILGEAAFRDIWEQSQAADWVSRHADLPPPAFDHALLARFAPDN